ncbi:unnamed protein product, partial [Owenia fusiformis]
SHFRGGKKVLLKFFKLNLLNLDLVSEQSIHALIVEIMLTKAILTFLTSKVVLKRGRTTHNLVLSSRKLGLSGACTDKKLFTPGPLCVSMTTKQAMLRDLGSRDTEFVDTVKYIRSQLENISGSNEDAYTCIPIQGSGTFAVESIFQTTVPRTNAKVLILANGAYGKRMAAICRALNIDHHIELFPENEQVSSTRVEELLQSDNFSNVSIVHCETSSGVVNPIQDIGRITKEYQPNALYIVDAMSSFGAIPINMEASNIDFLATSANKCLQGVPGFAFVIAKVEQLKLCKGQSRSLSLDLLGQYTALENTGQFRFTPPTHTMLALKQALAELEEEGGVEGRAKRYQNNCSILRDGMSKLGFKEFLSDEHTGYIITSFYMPSDPQFTFTDFYSKLSDLGQVIYPGKVNDADCFRIGNIGDLSGDDMRHLLMCVKQVCKDMCVKLPLS